MPDGRRSPDHADRPLDPCRCGWPPIPAGYAHLGLVPDGLRAPADAGADGIDEAHGGLWLSAISVWEIAMLHERGRMELEGGPRRWVEHALARFPLNEAPVTREIALLSREVAVEHRDPADRMIAATAVVHDLTLVTVDERLRSVDGLRTLTG